MTCKLIIQQALQRTFENYKNLDSNSQVQRAERSRGRSANTLDDVLDENIYIESNDGEDQLLWYKKHCKYSSHYSSHQSLTIIL